MSNVEIAKILIFAFASVSESPLSIPVRLKSSGHATFRHFQLGLFFHSELKRIFDKSKTTLPGFCSHFKTAVTDCLRNRFGGSKLMNCKSFFKYRQC